MKPRPVLTVAILCHVLFPLVIPVAATRKKHKKEEHCVPTGNRDRFSARPLWFKPHAIS